MPQRDAMVIGLTDDAPSYQDPRRRNRRTIAWLSIALTGSVVTFLTWGVDGHWDFALPRRLEQLAALAVVGVAVAISTVIFHTLTENHILTPSIMGFDALYVLLATSFVFVIGGTAYQEIPDLWLFAINATMLIVSATLLYRWILSDESRGLYTLVLIGVIAATLFGSVTSFMVRVMDPNEFETLMSDLFASFNNIDTQVLGIASGLLLVGTLAAMRMIPELDVLTLGRERAITLGIDYRPLVTRLLIVVAILVAVSTAMVGPITFLGLLVANLAYRLLGTQRHTWTFPTAAIISVTALVLGQTALQHLLSYSGTLGSIINLVGGVFFVILLVGKSRS